MMPGVFVMLWSTGFLGAKLGLPYVEPFTFLLLRFLILTVILVAAALVLRAPWPSTWAEFAHLGTVGLLVHGMYLGGVFSSIHAGLPPRPWRCWHGCLKVVTFSGVGS